jgi:LPXTG-motif cell wall-anchored protein
VTSITPTSLQAGAGAAPTSVVDPGASRLPTTGGDSIGALRVVLVLIVAGIGLVLVARRRAS